MSQVATTEKNSLIFARTAERFGVRHGDLSKILRATAFRGSVSDEQMAALLIVAEQFKLNPFTREIYAFPDKGGGIVPVIGVDGWNRIVNEHPAMDGFEFRQSENMVDASGHKCPEWIECLIYRKDRSHPVIVREYIDECSRNTEPWKSHPKRMLRHKAFIQAARMAFGFSGIYDDDEAERIAEARVIEAQNQMAAPLEVESDHITQTPELPPSAKFEELLEDMGITGERRPLAEEYIQICCKQFNCNRDVVIGKFIEREEEFRRIYPDWEKNTLNKRQTEKEKTRKKGTTKQSKLATGPTSGEQEAATQEAELLEAPSAPTNPAPKLTPGDILCPLPMEDGSQRIVDIEKCDNCQSRENCPAHEPSHEMEDMGL